MNLDANGGGARDRNGDPAPRARGGPELPLTVGVDLGGTKILAAAVDARHDIRGLSKIATPAREGNAAILAAILSCVNEAVLEAGAALADVAAIGVGSPGPLDRDAGVIPFSANLRVRDFALGPDLARATGRPVVVDNDVRVGGYGEFKLGAGRGRRNLLAVFVGTGIGGCLVVDGRVFDGATGNAGEIGHVVVKAGGPKCGCGNRGCMETLASRSAIARRILKELKSGKPSALRARLPKVKDAGRIKSKDIRAGVDLNDPIVVSAVQRGARYLGIGLGGLINAIAPERIVVGGGIAVALGEPYLEIVRAHARRQAITDTKRVVEIVAGELGDHAGVLGAALIARERFAPDSIRPEWFDRGHLVENCRAPTRELPDPASPSASGPDEPDDPAGAART